MTLAKVERALERYGLLLVTDQRLPSVASIVAGEPVRGSWWGHSKSHAIYVVCGALIRRPDVLSVKLVERKVTYVIKRLWPALFGAATGRDRWQTQGLTSEARKLLRRVDHEGSVQLLRADKAARLLERRLLVYTMQVHTDAGAHALVLLSWDALARQLRWKGKPLPSAKGRAALDQAARTMAGL